jgi:hypothetical protein
MHYWQHLHAQKRAKTRLSINGEPEFVILISSIMLVITSPNALPIPSLSVSSVMSLMMDLMDPSSSGRCGEW